MPVHTTQSLPSAHVGDSRKLNETMGMNTLPLLFSVIYIMAEKNPNKQVIKRCSDALLACRSQYSKTPISHILEDRLVFKQPGNKALLYQSGLVSFKSLSRVTKINL